LTSIFSCDISLSSAGGKIILQRKTQIILALLVSSVFLFQNCAIIIKGTSQKIPVTSNPAGAKIIVDGEEIGYAPLNLKLKKKKSHIVRIEKSGYNPFEVRIVRKTSKAHILRNLLLGGSMVSVCAIGFFRSDYSNAAPSTLGLVCLIGGGVLLLTAPFIVDIISSADHVLYPKELNVTLKKIEGKLQPNFILIDTEHFQNIRWIRIKCAGSDGEEEVVNLD